MKRTLARISIFIGIVVVACFVLFAIGWFIFVIFFQKDLRNRVLTQAPTKTSYETLLLPTKTEAYGMQIIKKYYYKATKNTPWYLDFPKNGVNQIGDESFILINQRVDSVTVNVEIFSSADHLTETTDFHTLNFQDSLLLSNSGHWGPSALKVYSLSGGLLAWINTGKIFK